MSSNTFQKGSRVLVTGVNGFIATHVAIQLLQAGYSVTGTVRSQAKADVLQEFIPTKYGSDKFNIIITEDMEKEGAFDEAVKDVDAIAHVASPTNFDPENPIRDVVNPAVNGTINLLESAHKYGNKVKHVVVTSSVSAIINPLEQLPYVYTEKDWNEMALGAVSQWKEGDPVNGLLTYAASKVAAERALFKFQKEVSPKFTINTILPGTTFGAIISTPKSAKDITGTRSHVTAYYNGLATDVTTSNVFHHYVNVEDVALAHVLAIEKGSETNGERFILVARGFTLQETVDILRKHYPERKDIIVEGTPGKYPTLTQLIDGSKATERLGIEYKSLETTLIELIDSVKQLFQVEQ
ncbi:putative cinnamoyl-CoA reductase [Umbelopsis sp. AD052]|nr:putative cinnamoyl-CoA reductase [Umbelopsis sp. AD052]